MMEKVSRVLNAFNLPETGIILSLECWRIRLGLSPMIICPFKIIPGR